LLRSVLRKEWDALAASHPDRLTVVYSLDKPSKGWTGSTGYITPELVKKHAAIAAEKAGDKVKVFVCGVSLPFSSLFPLLALL
jgi:NAD(P)H-flavin reductase